MITATTTPTITTTSTPTTSTPTTSPLTPTTSAVATKSTVSTTTTTTTTTSTTDSTTTDAAPTKTFTATSATISSTEFSETMQSVSNIYSTSNYGVSSSIQPISTIYSEFFSSSDTTYNSATSPTFSNEVESNDNDSTLDIVISVMSVVLTFIILALVFYYLKHYKGINIITEIFLKIKLKKLNRKINVAEYEKNSMEFTIRKF